MASVGPPDAPGFLQEVQLLPLVGLFDGPEAPQSVLPRPVAPHHFVPISVARDERDSAVSGVQVQATVLESSRNRDPAGLVRVHVVDPTLEGAVCVHVVDDSASGDDDPVSGLFDAFDVSLERTSVGLPDTSKIRRSRCDRLVAPCKDWLWKVPIPTRRSMRYRDVHRLDGRFSRGRRKGCRLEVSTPCWRFIWTSPASEWGHEESRDDRYQIRRLHRSPPFTAAPSRLRFRCWKIRVVGGVGAGRSSMSAGPVEACGCGRARSGPKTRKRSGC